MGTTILTAPKVELDKFDNLFIELTNQNCNLKCKHCYINFEPYKKIKDFISIDIIKQAISDLKNFDIKMIYLTGGEPLLHPDFNAILRYCLKKYNVCICTNGSFLNEKKIRFLNRVESEGNNQIFFKLSLVGETFTHQVRNTQTHPIRERISRIIGFFLHHSLQHFQTQNLIFLQQPRIGRSVHYK